jgi:hypothetical protein
MGVKEINSFLGLSRNLLKVVFSPGLCTLKNDGHIFYQPEQKDVFKLRVDRN